MLNEISLISDIVKTVSETGKNAGNIANAASNVKETTELMKKMSSPNSLSKKAKDGIYEFPFLISSNIQDPGRIASMIKGMELEYANMLLISMGLNPSSNGNVNIQLKKVLSEYHTNSNDFSLEDANCINGGIENRPIDIAFEDLSPADKQTMKDRTDDIKWNANYIKWVETMNKSNDVERREYLKSHPEEYGTDPAYPEEVEAKKKHDAEEAERLKREEIEKRDEAEREKFNHNKVVMASKVISNTYANMFNMTIVELAVRLGETTASEFKFPIGIKGIPHPLPYDDLCYVISSFLKPRSENGLIRFIKWRTGEIKGLHNLIFRYDEIKRDVEFDKRVGTNNSWLKVLRSRGNNRRLNLIARTIAKLRNNDKIKPNDILPNCSFVLSLSDVDLIEAETGINIFQNPRAASKMLDDAMGLGLCIFDETHSVCHIMYSGYDKFMSYPISAVAKGSDKGGDKTQILIDLMKKI